MTEKNYYFEDSAYVVSTFVRVADHISGTVKLQQVGNMVCISVICEDKEVAKVEQILAYLA